MNRPRPGCAVTRLSSQTTSPRAIVVTGHPETVRLSNGESFQQFELVAQEVRGAIIGVYRDEAQCDALSRALSEIGSKTIRPLVAGPA